jgi:exosortase E/protease (VPEID-CTERM system)
MATFALVKVQLLPFFPDLQVFPVERVLATNSLQVAIAEVCSGLEGVGLMLAFCTGWLWHLRNEFRFPRALLILPVAMGIAFLLNSVRISMLFAIAEFGFPEVATAGFHSQAGWIFFLAVAFIVSVVSRQVTWLQRPDRDPTLVVSPEGWRRNPVAAFLLPLLAILATGMLVSAISAGFETFYVLRLLACVIVLVIYRHSYLSLDWRFGWQGIVGGVLVFGVWISAAHWLVMPLGMPVPLAEMSAVERGLWIATRAAAAVITVPIAEELAFRGFLLRRFANADFMSIRLQDATPIALLMSSVLFGFTHGSFWVPGILAGLVYGALARYTGRIGEAVVAHATTNALLAVAVLWNDQWQLW